jgi:hypothetical protein
LVNVLYGNLIKINKKDKCESSSIEQYHKQSLSNQIVNCRRTWKICNQFLPVNEKITLPKESKIQLSISDKVSSFSEDQMEAIASIIGDSLSFKLKFQITKLKIKAQVIKLLVVLKLNKQSL